MKGVRVFYDAREYRQINMFASNFVYSHFAFFSSLHLCLHLHAVHKNRKHRLDLSWVEKKSNKHIDMWNYVARMKPFHEYSIS